MLILPATSALRRKPVLTGSDRHGNEHPGGTMGEPEAENREAGKLRALPAVPGRVFLLWTTLAVAALHALCMLDEKDS